MGVQLLPRTMSALGGSAEPSGEAVLGGVAGTRSALPLRPCRPPLVRADRPVAGLPWFALQG